MFENFLHDATIVLTLLLLEAVLSFDNAAILAAMVRKLPLADRRKALLYGLGGAYVLRFSAIALASFLIDNPILKILGGAYLVFISVKHFVRMAQHRGDGHRMVDVKPGLLARWGVPALVAVIVQIELVDLAFAIDQVIVAVAFTPKVYLIVVASFVGILFLRLAAAMIARVMDWLPLLEHMAYVAVTYVGVKLVLLYPVDAINHGHGVHIPTPISITITLLLFLVPVIIKLVFDWPRSIPAGVHVAAATAEPPKPAPDASKLKVAHKDVKEAPREIDGVPQPPRPPEPPQ